ncbi:conserved hypothetical protein [Cronobacter dublinensis 582]|nr:conserved hypothetical protein [Cronobacter dublinensis 582]
MHQRVAGSERFEFIRRGHERLAGERSELFRHAFSVFRVRIKPGADRRAAERQLRQMRQAVVDMLKIVLKHRHPAGDLLAERQRRGVLQMRTADFHDIGEGARLVAERLVQHLQLRDQLFAQRDNRRDVHRRRENVVRTLAFVNVIIGVNFARHPALAAEDFARPVGQHFVHVHVGLGAGAGLPDGQRELLRVRAFQHLVRRVDNGVAALGRQQAEIHIDLRGGAFRQRQRLDKRGRHFLGGNTKMLKRSLRLRAPEFFGRHVDGTHGIFFTAVGGHYFLLDNKDGMAHMLQE